MKNKYKQKEKEKNTLPTTAFKPFPPCAFSECCIKMKTNLNFYFHTSLWYLKRFYKGLKGLYRTF